MKCRGYPTPYAKKNMNNGDTSVEMVGFVWFHHWILSCFNRSGGAFVHPHAKKHNWMMLITFDNGYGD